MWSVSFTVHASLSAVGESDSSSWRDSISFYLQEASFSASVVSDLGLSSATISSVSSVDTSPTANPTAEPSTRPVPQPTAAAVPISPTAASSPSTPASDDDSDNGADDDDDDDDGITTATATLGGGIAATVIVLLVGVYAWQKRRKLKSSVKPVMNSASEEQRQRPGDEDGAVAESDAQKLSETRGGEVADDEHGTGAAESKDNDLRQTSMPERSNKLRASRTATMASRQPTGATSMKVIPVISSEIEEAKAVGAKAKAAEEARLKAEQEEANGRLPDGWERKRSPSEPGAYVYIHSASGARTSLQPTKRTQQVAIEMWLSNSHRLGGDQNSRLLEHDFDEEDAGAKAKAEEASLRAEQEAILALALDLERAQEEAQRAQGVLKQDLETVQEEARRAKSEYLKELKDLTAARDEYSTTLAEFTAQSVARHALRRELADFQRARAKAEEEARVKAEQEAVASANKCVGEDTNGNKFYENNIHGEHRWVEYTDIQDSMKSALSPAWHKWMCHMLEASEARAEEEARRKAEQEAEEARLKAEQEAEEARLKAEQEAEEARLKAEQEAEEVKAKDREEARQLFFLKAEQDANAARAKADGEARLKAEKDAAAAKAKAAEEARRALEAQEHARALEQDLQRAQEEARRAKGESAKDLKDLAAARDEYLATLAEATAFVTRVEVMAQSDILRHELEDERKRSNDEHLKELKDLAVAKDKYSTTLAEATAFITRVEMTALLRPGFEEERTQKMPRDEVISELGGTQQTKAGSVDNQPELDNANGSSLPSSMEKWLGSFREGLDASCGPIFRAHGINDTDQLVASQDKLHLVLAKIEDKATRREVRSALRSHFRWAATKAHSLERELRMAREEAHRVKAEATAQMNALRRELEEEPKRSTARQEPKGMRQVEVAVVIDTRAPEDTNSRSLSSIERGLDTSIVTEFADTQEFVAGSVHYQPYLDDANGSSLSSSAIERWLDSVRDRLGASCGPIFRAHGIDDTDQLISSEDKFHLILMQIENKMARRAVRSALRSHFGREKKVVRGATVLARKEFVDPPQAEPEDANIVSNYSSTTGRGIEVVPEYSGTLPTGAAVANNQQEETDAPQLSIESWLDSVREGLGASCGPIFRSHGIDDTDQLVSSEDKLQWVLSEVEDKKRRRAVRSALRTHFGRKRKTRQEGDREREAAASITSAAASASGLLLSPL